MNLLLIGPRGCGKTSIGRLAASICDRAFIDLDDRVVDLFAEPTVSSIWETHGEEAFRAAEVRALREVLAEDEQIIALGGGTPMIDAARELIQGEQAAGTVYVVYLSCPPDALIARLRAEPGDRPSLTGEDVAGEVAAVLTQREPTYRGLADKICETFGKDPQAVAAEILKAESP